MVLALWNIRGPSTIEPDLEEYYNGANNFFTIKIHHSGFLTKYPGRMYIEGKVTFVDFVDTDVFCVHDLNQMIREIGLRALGNDQDVIAMTKYVPKYRVINVYVEHGITRVPTYFMSPTKVVMEQLDDEPAPEISRSKPKHIAIGSSSRLLDDEFTLISAVQTQSIVPFQRHVHVVEDGVHKVDQGVPVFDSYVPVVEQGPSIQDVPMVEDGVQKHDQGVPVFDSYVPVVEQGPSMQDVPMVEDGVLVFDSYVPTVEEGPSTKGVLLLEQNMEDVTFDLDNFQPFPEYDYQHMPEFDARPQEVEVPTETEVEGGNEYIVDPEAVVDD